MLLELLEEDDLDDEDEKVELLLDCRRRMPLPLPSSFMIERNFCAVSRKAAALFSSSSAALPSTSGDLIIATTAGPAITEILRTQTNQSFIKQHIYSYPQ